MKKMHLVAGFILIAVLIFSPAVRAVSITITQNGVEENDVSIPVENVQPVVENNNNGAVTNVVSVGQNNPPSDVNVSVTTGNSAQPQNNPGATITVETNENIIQLPAECQIGGCSGQLCYDPATDPGMTTCQWQDEYACYKNAICQRQADGKCSWTQTDQLKSCLGGIKPSPTINPCPGDNCISVPPADRCNIVCPLKSAVDMINCQCLGGISPTVKPTPTDKISPFPPVPPMPPHPRICQLACPDGHFKIWGSCKCHRIPRPVLLFMPFLKFFDR
ncbi:hypothetical protein A2154_00935 [Candidatus Gottesmanbacteria bacterium RBG_16_43_7]|uniref:Uncharacterized protein n=1 Tax=Candidatus Gottesmanbacteria bacterium RBG_16_43_7 TaxID=1798373 RepID=A0A1F5Z915_9BACT|nr:MAG: hypothetical protein A2154_00935 [Candidatus Gottesmanbacteria bacterium RBG_16_43_7]